VLLHTVSTSPFHSSALDSCIRAAAPGSTILLLADAVYAARAGTDPATKLAALEGLRCFALAPDVNARGLENLLAAHIELASYDDFVRLSIECHAVQSWY
jgi:tRNA 2-thiouridine synthesizing protein B